MSRLKTDTLASADKPSNRSSIDALTADITASIAELCIWNPANADIWADSEGAYPCPARTALTP